MAKRQQPDVAEFNAEDIAEALAAKRHARSDWSRTWQAISVILSIGAIVFTVGAWWNKTSAIETRVANLESQLQTITNKQSDQSRDAAVLLQKVDQISISVAEIKGQQQRPLQSQGAR
jgi:hypothetical protein